MAYKWNRNEEGRKLGQGEAGKLLGESKRMKNLLNNIRNHELHSEACGESLKSLGMKGLQ